MVKVVRLLWESWTNLPPQYTGSISIKGHVACTAVEQCQVRRWQVQCRETKIGSKRFNSRNDEGLCPSTVACYGSTLRGFKRPETFTFGDPHLNSTRSIHTQSTVMMTQLRNKTDISMEEGFIQKQRQRSSRLFGGQNLLNSLPR